MPHPLSAALRAYAQPEYRLPAGAAANLEAAAEALDASAATRALLEGLRDRMLARASAAADQCNHFDDGRCDAHRFDADLLDEALNTLNRSDR